MRKYLCLLPILLLTVAAQAQSEALTAFNLKQGNVLQVGMLVLGGWAIINIMVSSFKLTKTTRARRHFYQMNLYWNIVNLIIATIALHHIITSNSIQTVLAESVQQHFWYKKILYLNIGLDLGYIVLGALLRQRSRTSILKTEKLHGWGQSIMLQGLFLFLLDLVLAVMLEKNTSHLLKLISEV